MTTPPKKRGRPKSEKTLEREAIETLLKNPPHHIKIMTEEEKQWWIAFKENSEKAQHAILESHSPLLPHSLIYELESLGDESMHGHEQAILNKYNKRLNEIWNGNAAGTKKIKTHSKSRAESVWAKNNTLFARIKSKKISLNGAAKIISDQWSTRGDGLEKPTTKTISNWFRRLDT